MSENYHLAAKRWKPFIPINKGAWIDIEQRYEWLTPVNLISYTDGDRLRIKSYHFPTKHVCWWYVVPCFVTSQPHMFEIKKARHCRKKCIFKWSNCMIGRNDVMLLLPILAGNARGITTCGSAGIMITAIWWLWWANWCASLVLQQSLFFSWFHLILMSDSSITRKENGWYSIIRRALLQRLVYHEVKIWDRETGEVYDLKAGGLGLGMNWSSLELNSRVGNYK